MPLLPFDDRDGWIWMDGHLVPWREAGIHLLTHSLHYGGSVFEGERAYDGRIFQAREHAERLRRSGLLLGYEVPICEAEIDRVKYEVIDRMGLGDCYVRAIAWRGSETMGVSARDATIHVAVAAWKWGDYFADRMAGIRLSRTKWRRPSPESAPCHAKASGLYMICTLAKHEAEAQGFADALMLDYRGRVAETTGANIFFVRDGVLHTPVPDCFLDGITRRFVIGLARKRGYQIVERAIMPGELNAFSECFVTGTAAEITPVSEIAEHRYRPSVITENLIADFDAAVRAPQSGLQTASAQQ